MSDQLATALLNDTGAVLGELVIRYAPAGQPCAACTRAAALELDVGADDPVPLCSRCLLAGAATRIGAAHLHAGGSLEDLRYRVVDEPDDDAPVPPEWT